MSALDQAFIKAFAKEPSAAVPRTPPSSNYAPATSTHDHGESAAFDAMYDAGAFYRVDAEAGERTVPHSHLQPERKVPRRLQRRTASRPEVILPEPTPVEPVAESSPMSLPPRRNWSRSMLEVARQLARLDLLQRGTDGELPPEIVFSEPPAPEVPPEPIVHHEQNLAVEPTAELPPSAPQAIANLWAVDGPIVAHSSLISLADAETWLALPMAPAVTCTESVANGWQTTNDTEEATAETEIAEAAIVATPIEKKSKRKLRIDNSHASVPAPHVAPVATSLEDELQIVEDMLSAPESIAISPTASPEGLPTTEQTQPAVSTPEEAKPAEQKAEQQAEQKVVEATVPKRPYVPLWEVDRFTWPALCDKLMHDPSGYFASASSKLLSVVRGGLKVLGVTGSRRGEGRTTLALCLARAAAQAGIHVALVDADFTRPQLASMLGLETAYGWQEAATGKIPLSEAAVKSLADRLTVLPLEVTSSSAPLSLADPRVTATLRATAATFELVIVDLGPLGAGSEPLFPKGENCPLDAAVVVRDTRFASVGESRTVGDRLYESGIEAVGIAENFVTHPEISFL
ncbi:hypothetical protein ETAA8_63530 [Anatilimnocola aggregata]|uniref:Uncharacterized protein n=1 Tax=Anatilimnocola aggregata TaxID=2528021 RepID=A0A517YLV8_9BACT|nr:P-loop NTPase [Anatilimnocola aggregata]QDU31200.1 hypothetical protein ETAA8_63530 [Anatilimnocola aggregata]